ncbi:MAG: 6-phospho-beta-glucosidase [Oscillospiraceae bacterium]|nr:6-phospho-beta-glucosidase [Oscillospiraceae bacterium]
MKISIIGAGSSYTPELIEKLAEIKERLPVTKISLMDIDSKRLEAVSGFCKRYAKKLDLQVKLESTTDLDKAVSGSSFICPQIRVGGNICRINDEKIPLSMGLIGQETTGPGGFMKALRTIPAMMEIADSMKKNAPDAWMINYTNPTGIISQVLHDYTDIKCAALCSGGIRPAWIVSEVLGVNAKDVKYDIFGLNHLNYAYNITIKGRSLTKHELNKVASDVDTVSAELSVKLGVILSGYLQYYYHRNTVLKKLQKEKKSRGEVVLEMEKEIFKDFNNPEFADKPPSLKKRGGGGYSTVATDVMTAIYNNNDTWHVVNVPNNGVFKFLPDNAVVETAVLINSSGIKPVTAEPPPKAVWGLISMVKNYEMLTAEAAVTGDYDTALMALTHHPLVGDYDVAKKLFDKMLEANKDYLPLFFKK